MWVFQDAASVTRFHPSPDSLCHEERQSRPRETGEGLLKWVGALIRVPGDCKARCTVSAEAPPASHSLDRAEAPGAASGDGGIPKWFPGGEPDPDRGR